MNLAEAMAEGRGREVAYCLVKGLVVELWGNPTSRGGFYRRALSQAERELLPEAREVEGLDEEIALLRVKLSQLLEEHPEDTELLLKGVGMLVRAVATRHRLSKAAEDDLYQNILGVIRGIGGVMFPEGFHEV